ncbi:hypothetical protein, partial [Salmonella enterica]
GVYFGAGVILGLLEWDRVAGRLLWDADKSGNARFED